MELPKEFKKRMKDMLQNEYEEFNSSFLDSPIYSGIRINTLKKNAKEAVLSEFGKMKKIPWCDNGYYIENKIISGNHPYHIAGLFYFQEASAMSVAEGLPINKGDKILDLCAAPGGKSTQAAAKLNGSGLIVSNEIIRKRAVVLSGNIERMGIKNAVVTNEAPKRLSEKYEGYFDKIIVDAPCSGEGMFRKEPQAVTEWSLEHTNSCAVRQRHILDCAYKMLKPNGYIIYSTCTFAPVENEENIAYMIDKFNMELCEIPELGMLDDGRGEWSGSDYDMKNSKRIFPHHQNGEGHFIALLKKKNDENIVKSKQIILKAPDISLYKKFEKEFLNIDLNGEFALFGDNLYLKPDGIDIDKINVIRCGLHLGVIKKNRFEPSHSLCLALEKKDFKNSISFSCDDKKLHKYLKGDVINGNFKGWGAVMVNNYPIGWGKGSSGIIKNHIPKGVRIL